MGKNRVEDNTTLTFGEKCLEQSQSEKMNCASHVYGASLIKKAGKESACNAGDPGSIPGWGRSAGEEIDYPLQYSQASLVAQLIKNPMWETWVRSLGWEDPLEKGKATHSRILAWRIPGTVHGVAKNWTHRVTFTFPFPCI